ncbi:bifunctional protein-disulfide isomerase/oxidoreductase DsbC [Pasteurella dagmatis]|uniref:Thiol:disulfide interchange protein n=1 Tax=Pasteurella dagmatis ATCC 43325 TaxID=667128 RepID=C9PRX9_9PAST|nr:bifunctional protein-disulfide isomerase/oxidoreductase DsbC [Pasteurella dagmatis]EEX49706.1 putative Thiol:disulfide interchange protein DsbC [Pasteurella dagmatis ATCC 43325]SNV70002.1 thiol:disulfide interchange protein DsbC [Pasteurella dagmatis]
MKKILTALFISVLSTTAMASSDAISERFNKMGLKGVEVSDSPIKGIKTAVTDNGIFYITEDAKYILDGKIYETSERGITDISAKLLLDKLKGYQKEMIVYPAKNEKHVVTVFGDISCHYCQVLHKQMKEYNELGITVRYLAFPRGGLDTNVARQMEFVFRAKEPQFSLDEAMKGNLPQQLLEPKIVKKHYQLGLQFGVNGTPTIVTEKGELIGGYLKPKDLLSALSH